MSSSTRKIRRLIEESEARGYLESPWPLSAGLVPAWEDSCKRHESPAVVVQKYPNDKATVMVQVLHTREIGAVEEMRDRVNQVAIDVPGVAIERRDEKQLVVVGPLPLARARSFARRFKAPETRETTGNS